MAGKDNLVARSPEEARELGRKGGKASGEARRKKKLLSEIYAEYLAAEHEISIDEVKRKLSGDALVSIVIDKVLAGGGSSAVGMLKEIREATEGSKISGADGGPVMIRLVKLGDET